MKLMIAALVSMSAVAFANPAAAPAGHATKEEKAVTTTTTTTEKKAAAATVDCKDKKNAKHAECQKAH